MHGGWDATIASETGHALGSPASGWEAPEEADTSSPSQQHVATPFKMAKHPGHYMNHQAFNLLDPTSIQYWASLPGHVHNQAFVFQLDQAQVLSRVEWKDRGDGMGVAKLSLEALVGEGWQKLTTWDASQTSEWQGHDMTMSLRSNHWRLTFVETHTDENHMVVQAVRFIVKLPQTSPAHNFAHAQLIATKLLKERLFTDVEVTCGAFRFPAHRALLAAASPVFRAMLSSEMVEARVQEVHIDDADEKSVQDTLEYIYTGTVGAGAGCGMVVLGHKYDIPGLVEYAAPVALANVTPENVVGEVRILRAHAADKQLGQLFDALECKVQENTALLRAVLLGI